MEQQQQMERQQRINKIIAAMERKKRYGTPRQMLVDHWPALEIAIDLAAKRKTEKADKQLANLEKALNEFMGPVKPTKPAEIREDFLDKILGTHVECVGAVGHYQSNACQRCLKEAVIRQTPSLADLLGDQFLEFLRRRDAAEYLRNKLPQMHAELQKAIQEKEALELAIQRVHEKNNELGAQLHFAKAHGRELLEATAVKVAEFLRNPLGLGLDDPETSLQPTSSMASKPPRQQIPQHSPAQMLGSPSPLGFNPQSPLSLGDEEPTSSMASSSNMQPVQNQPPLFHIPLPPAKPLRVPPPPLGFIPQPPPSPLRVPNPPPPPSMPPTVPAQQKPERLIVIDSEDDMEEEDEPVEEEVVLMETDNYDEVEMDISD